MEQYPVDRHGNRLPSEATHPGGVLGSELEARGITVEQLAEQTGIAADDYRAVVEGHGLYTPEMAIALESALGIEASQWIGFTIQYEADRAAIALFNLRKEQQKRLATRRNQTLNRNHAAVCA